jgi:serine/threonine protein kinase
VRGHLTEEEARHFLL